MAGINSHAIAVRKGRVNQMAKTRTPFAGVVLENQAAATMTPVVARIRIAGGTSMEDASKFVANAFKKLLGQDNIVEVPDLGPKGDGKDKNGAAIPEGTKKKVTLVSCEGILNLRD